MTEIERNDTKMATLYKIRLKITGSDKKTWTVEELTELLDTIATAKDQK